MELSPGQKLGPYEIVAAIGAGGMGAVYKARDPRLDRSVAIKVSKAEFSERFSREARTVAQLNHPNICTLFDVGSNYLVMELVDGVPLKGPLPVAKALEYAGQILDALDAAHRKRITHRDLKPANILVTRQGIKLLDFGLAKQVTGTGHDDVTMAALSTEGQLSGTLQYMSPEQLQGKEADPRSDIFAFGLVLYELITGARAFSGSSTASLIAAVLKEHPKPLTEMQPLTPVGLDRVLQTCLEKDPEQRWQSAREVKHALQWITQVLPVAAMPAAAPAAKPRIWQIAAAISTLIALGLAAWAFWPRPEPLAPVTRLQIALPDKVRLDESVSLSPDGRKVVVAGLTNSFAPTLLGPAEPGGLWIRDLNAQEWRPLPGTDGAASPFWSPDSRFIGFAVGSQMKKIDAATGAVQTLVTRPSNLPVGLGAWNRDGVIIFGGRGVGAIWKIPQSGGEPAPVTLLDQERKEAFHALPVFMPDGKHFLYLRAGTPETGGVYAGSLEAKPGEQSRARILPGNRTVLWVNGILFFPRGDTMMAQPFDPVGMKLRGEPVPVAENVDSPALNAMPSLSAAGETMVFRTRTPAAKSQLTWLDRQGKTLDTFGQAGADQAIVLSPDGTSGVVRDALIGNPGDLWRLDFARGVRTRLTFDRGSGSAAAWSPDGSRVVFARGVARVLESMYEKASSGAGEEREMLKAPGQNLRVTSWSRDGRFLLYYAFQSKGAGLWLLPLEGDRKPVALHPTEFTEVDGFFSPDMRWIAYSSDESGRSEVYVRPFTPSGDSGKPGFGEGKWQISRDGGGRPRWRSDGREMLFQASDGLTKMAVDIKATGTGLEAGVPHPLFSSAKTGSWDVTPDGKRFLAAVPQEQTAAQPPINIVLNWPSLLKKK